LKLKNWYFCGCSWAWNCFCNNCSVSYFNLGSLGLCL